MRAGELLGLNWEQVDIGEGKIILDPGTTKNAERRVVFMTGELPQTLEAQKAGPGISTSQFCAVEEIRKPSKRR